MLYGWKILESEEEFEEIVDDEEEEEEEEEEEIVVAVEFVVKNWEETSVVGLNKYLWDSK